MIIIEDVTGLKKSIVYIQSLGIPFLKTVCLEMFSIGERNKCCTLDVVNKERKQINLIMFLLSPF
jgi:hypothetical protein